MATDAWIEFGGTELVNLSRVTQLARVMGADGALYQSEDSVQWVQDALGEIDYDDITEAPWYDPSVPESSEFAGLVPLEFAGIEDSTLTSSPSEYVTDGGTAGRARSGTLPIVASVVLVASTERGSEYGRRWLNKVLRASGGSTLCAGADLRYFRYPDEDSPIAHRRDVKLTRGVSITRKHVSDCHALLFATFTFTAADPYEYGEVESIITELSAGAATGSGVVSSGSTALIQMPCAVWDYSPVFDPLHPALVAPPTAPDFYPAGWGIHTGASFDRIWAEIDPDDSDELNSVPVFTLESSTEIRAVRVSSSPTRSGWARRKSPTGYLPSCWRGTAVTSGLTYSTSARTRPSHART